MQHLFLSMLSCSLMSLYPCPPCNHVQQGFAFVNYASFEASDAAIESMNGQYLCNRQISVTYAFKKDTKGERHGSAAGLLCTDKRNITGNPNNRWKRKMSGRSTKSKSQ